MVDTYSLLVHKPSKAIDSPHGLIQIAAQTVVVGTGKSFAEASAWVRRSPRFRTCKKEA